MAVETTPVMEETYPEVPRPLTVDTNESVLTYPEVPRPATVDARVAIFVPPGPSAVEKEEIAFVTNVVEAYPIEPNPATVEIRLPPPLPFVSRTPEK